MAAIEVQDRPYLLTSAGAAFPLTAEDARRLVESYSRWDRTATVDSGGYRLVLRENASHVLPDFRVAYVIPATLGGGVPFRVSK